MTYKVFVDSDVVIDFFTDRDPHANAASEIFELNDLGKLKVYLSAVSINNIYYVVRRLVGHKKAIKIIEDLIAMTEIIGTGKKEIVQALKNDFADFEDSIQYASVMANQDINAIITRNIRDYKNSSIAVMTPINFLKMLDKIE